MSKMTNKNFNKLERGSLRITKKQQQQEFNIKLKLKR